MMVGLPGGWGEEVEGVEEGEGGEKSEEAG